MIQLDLFNSSDEFYKIKKHIRLIELFGGIGSQAMSLRDLHADFETYKLVEFDKYAIKSYNAIHHTNFKTLDITKVHAKDLEIINTDQYEYIMTYSFPCQDLSLAGKQKGMKKGSDTRSGLLWEVERILKECKELPQVLLMENVTQVHSTKNIKDFNKWRSFLKSLGYTSYYQDLNAKDYGVPQNRNRCFMISILGNYLYNFPNKIKLTKNVKSILEEKVDNKYYLSDKMLKYINNAGTKNFYYKPEINLDVARPITSTIAKMHRAGTDNYYSNDYFENKCIQVGSINLGNNESNNRVYSPYGCCPTINTMQGGHRQPKIIEAEKAKSVKIKQATKEGYINCKIEGVADLSYPNSKTRRGRVIKNGDISPTLMTDADICKIESVCRIRKLTPLECWRLMGFTDQDFYEAAKVNSNSQLYKQAGNSIVKNVLMAIFKQLL